MTVGVEKIEALSEPDVLDAANTIVNGVTANNLITVHAQCSTDYEGRAKGGIDKGERILIIKPKSGTFLVHGDEDYKPINWQPSKADITVEITDDDELLLRAETDEMLEVLCSKVYRVTVFNNTDEASLELEGTEEEMHNRIMNNPELVEEGLSNLENEKEFDFGRVDIFAYDRDGVPVIIEVKRRAATRDHVYQLYTYVMEYRQERNEDVRGVLAAPKCTEYIKDVLSSHDLEFSEVEALNE
jgi:RecB family endonuclease NucS